jgi:hypothetical protein
MNKMATQPMAGAETAEAPKRKRRIKLDGERNWTRTIVMLIVPALLILGGGY